MEVIKGRVTKADMQASKSITANSEDHEGFFWNSSLGCPLFQALKRMGHEPQSVSLRSVRFGDYSMLIDDKTQEIISKRSGIVCYREEPENDDFHMHKGEILSSNEFNFTLTKF